MSRRLMIVCVIAAVALVGCKSGEDDSGTDDGTAGASDPISDDEANRYQLALSGEVNLDHTGGLLCRVDDGVLSFAFGIDAYNGPISYAAEVPGFDPGNTAFEGTFTFEDSPGQSQGPIEITFSMGDPPEGYEGVVRAAGVITGSMSGDAGAADINGTYACFLMDAEVGR